MTAPKLFLALDVPTSAQAMELIDELADVVDGFKLGYELFFSAGAELAKQVKKKNKQLFVDLKLHDIPRTVEAGVRSLAGVGADLLTVHASGGSEMLAAAVGAADKHCTVVAVTVLTSHTQATLDELSVNEAVGQHALRLGRLALQVGAGGLVCSPLEAKSLRLNFGPKPVLVCPGIRPSGSASGDQKRVATPALAVAEGASVLVVGRPILEASNRVLAASNIQAEMNQARSQS